MLAVPEVGGCNLWARSEILALSRGALPSNGDKQASGKVARQAIHCKGSATTIALASRT